VPTTLVNPQKYKKFMYSTTPKKKRLGIEIEANIPVDIYIVQVSDLQDWRDSRDYGGISFQSTKLVDAQINIPKGFESDWYLIIENPNEKPAAVHYDLFDL